MTSGLGAGGPHATTQVLALLGDPVEHSLSPIMQNAALQAAGIDAVYVALRVAGGEFEGLMRALAYAGGGGNVTLPHKTRAAELLDRPTDAVLQTGACNTFWFERGQLAGDNTDVEGFTRAAASLVPELRGARVLLVGAGGAARAALHGLIGLGVDRVDLLNRTVSTARALADSLGGARTQVLAGATAGHDRDYDLVVQATRLGLADNDPLPLNLDRLRSVGALLDLVYAPRSTPLVRAAIARGIAAADGLDMLVYQGAAAFSRWWGRDPSVEVMFDAVRAVREGASARLGSQHPA